MTQRIRLLFAGSLLLAAAGCEVSSVGVSYGYNDPFYWNDYYYGRRDINVDVEVTPPDRPDRPVRPEPPIARPPVARPPIARPPTARPPSVRPPTHRPARPAGGARVRR